MLQFFARYSTVCHVMDNRTKCGFTLFECNIVRGISNIAKIIKVTKSIIRKISRTGCIFNAPYRVLRIGNRIINSLKSVLLWKNKVHNTVLYYTMLYTVNCTVSLFSVHFLRAELSDFSMEIASGKLRISTFHRYCQIQIRNMNSGMALAVKIVLV